MNGKTATGLAQIFCIRRTSEYDIKHDAEEIEGHMPKINLPIQM